MSTNVTSIKTLRENLMSLYNDFRNGEVATSVAKETANIAGKIIQAAKVELTYKLYKNEIEPIEFLD